MAEIQDNLQQSDAVETLQEWESTAKDYLQSFRNNFSEIDRRFRDTVTARPIACAAGAFFIGYVAAKLSRSMWRR